jgi:hypothetical protein
MLRCIQTRDRATDRLPRLSTLFEKERGEEIVLTSFDTEQPYSWPGGSAWLVKGEIDGGLLGSLASPPKIIGPGTTAVGTANSGDKAWDDPLKLVE